MSARTCPITGENLPPGRFISTRAVGIYRHLLLDLPGLMEDLDIELTRQAKHAPPVRHGARSTDTGALPWSEAASRAAWITRQTLLCWVDDIARRRNEPTPTTWATISRYMRDTATWLAAQADAPNAVEEIRYALTMATQVIDRNTLHTYPLHIPCGRPDENGDSCPGQYQVTMREDQAWIPDMVCDKDPGHIVTPIEWQRALRKAPHPEGAAQLLAALHGEDAKRQLTELDKAGLDKHHANDTNGGSI